MARLGKVIDDLDPTQMYPEGFAFHHRFYFAKKRREAEKFQRTLARRIAIRLQIQALESKLEGL